MAAKLIFKSGLWLKKGVRNNSSYQIFLELFGKFDGEHQSGAAPVVITIHQKVPRDIFIHNVEKIKLLA